MIQSSKKFPLDRFEWMLALLITAALFWLHIQFWLHAGGLWRDEVNTVNLAQTHSFAMMNHDSFPVLVPFLLDIYGRLGYGGNDSALRFLGMLLGLGITAAFWTVAFVTRRPPLFGLILFGLNALLICYGDSLRAYGLGSAFILLSLAMMWWLLKKPSWSRAMLLALAATLSVQTLYQNAVLFFAISLGGFAVCAWRKDFPTAVKIMAAGSVAAVSLLPYYTTLEGLPGGARVLRRGFSPLVTSINYQMAAGFPFGDYATIWKILLLSLIVLALVWRLKRNHPPDEDSSLVWFAGMAATAVVVLFLTFLWLAAAGARPWYFIPPLALLAACFDCGLTSKLLPRLVHVALFGFLVGTAAISIPAAHDDLKVHFSNADDVAKKVGTWSLPRDFVVVGPWFCGITFSRYFQGPAAWQTLPPLTDHLTHRYDLLLNEMADTNCLAPVIGNISTALKSGHRVWLVTLFQSIPPSAVEPAILPPPSASSGWQDSPYNSSWSERTGYYLARHSTSFNLMPDNAGQAIYLQENLRVYLAEGWRD